MPTDKPRVTFTIGNKALERLERYRFDIRAKNQTQAILSLLEIGLNDYESGQVPEAKYSKDALAVAGKYDSLDSWGQKAVDAVVDAECSRMAEAERTHYVLPLWYMDEPPTADTHNDEEETGNTVHSFSVPLQESPAAAGYGEQAGDGETTSVDLKRAPPRGTSYMVRVIGDSMEPTYCDGDELFIHAQSDLRIGDVGIFYMDGCQYVKELGRGVLISHNPDYPPIRMMEDIRCQGKVLGVCDDSYR